MKPFKSSKGQLLLLSESAMPTAQHDPWRL